MALTENGIKVIVAAAMYSGISSKNVLTKIINTTMSIKNINSDVIKRQSSGDHQKSKTKYNPFAISGNKGKKAKFAKLLPQGGAE